MNVWLSSGETHLWHRGRTKARHAMGSRNRSPDATATHYSGLCQAETSLRSRAGNRLGEPARHLFGQPQHSGRGIQSRRETSVLRFLFRTRFGTSKSCTSAKWRTRAPRLKESTKRGKRSARRGRIRGWSANASTGNEEAWSALIDRYKNLIFSIPIKYGFSTDEATDIFQSVCLELLSELPKLREAKALPKWIMQITAHKCFHRKQQQQRVELSDPNAELLERSTPAVAMEILRQAEEEQSLRQAMSELPARCRAAGAACFSLTSPLAPIRRLRRNWGSPWARSDLFGSGAWKTCANACWKRDFRDAPEKSSASLR